MDNSITYDTVVTTLDYFTNFHIIAVPPSVIEALGGKLNVRLHCSVNGAEAFRCGLVALGEGSGYISLSAKKMKAAGTTPGATVTVCLRPDDSRYGVDMPPELEELLRLDDEANDRFHHLAPGKQRYILQYLAKIKSSQLRIERSLRIMDNLRRLPRGKESYQGLFVNINEPL